jgi:hypothetical protein
VVVKILGAGTKIGDKMMNVKYVETITKWIKEGHLKVVDKTEIMVAILSKIVDEIKSSAKNLEITMKAIIKQRLITKCVTTS